MKRQFGDLFQKTYDLIIIGGGIIGAGVARDAALRGLDVLLVEKEDFAYGTTSRSTRLIHGGLRYLRMLEFRLVWQDLHEREVLLHIAPHLVNKIEFAIPLLRSRPLYRLSLPFGLFLYDILASGKSLPSHQHLSLNRTLQVEPALGHTSDLTGSYIFFDCQAQNMERLCLENALSAAEKGACILNHAEATDLLFESAVVTGVRIRDSITGKDYDARGRVVLNAAGPGANLLWNKLNIKHSINLRRTKGVHLITHKLANHALVLFAKSDGRLFFIIPWNDWSLVGTTDTGYSGDPDSVSTDKSDVDYLVKETRNYFPQFKLEDIYYTMAGLRPLAASGNTAESNISRAHKLIDHERKDGVKGLVSIIGGKITAYRAIAEEAVDVVCKKLDIKASCSTSKVLLPGALDLDQLDIHKVAREQGLPVETINYLVRIYGSRLYSVLEYVEKDRRLASPIAPGYPDIRAQIKHAVREEEALTVNDFLFRRSILGLGPSQGRGAVETVIQEMASLLDWSEGEKQKQIRDYDSWIDISQRWRRE
jgi:glycerol-3-phosphate dehydrogenase